MRKVWSRRAPTNITSAGRHFAVALMCSMYLFVAGCDGREPSPSEAGSEQTETASNPEALSESVDSLRQRSGDQSVADRLRDASLATEVQLALMNSRELRAYRFDPVAVDGRVVLQGEVETRAQREQAASIAAGIDGVEEVINEIASTEQPELAIAGEERPSEDEGASEASSEEPIATDEDAAAEEAEAAPEEESQETYHTVQSGENLWVIARSHGVSVEQIRRLNDLGSNTLQPGERLRVK